MQEEFYGKEVVLADREFVENVSDLQQACTHCCALCIKLCTRRRECCFPGYRKLTRFWMRQPMLTLHFWSLGTRLGKYSIFALLEHLVTRELRHCKLLLCMQGNNAHRPSDQGASEGCSCPCDTQCIHHECCGGMRLAALQIRRGM